MEISELHPNYHIFGNKGAVHSNTAHIAKHGQNPNTLCGLPMLSTNWARLHELKTIGCEKCLEIYNQEIKP
jgi:hypothetical protein